MKIINFGVNNFRCISGDLKNNTINFDNSNTLFLFGQNNTGKSTFLHSYEFFYEDSKPKTEDFYKLDQTKEIEVIIEVELTDSEIEKFGDKKDNAIIKYFRGKKLVFLKRWAKEGKPSNNYTLKKDATDIFDLNSYEDIGYAGVGGHSFFKPMLPIPILIKAMPSESDAESIVNTLLSAKVKELLSDKDQEDYKKAEETIRILQEKTRNHTDIAKYKEAVNGNFKSIFPDLEIDIIDNDPEAVIRAIDKKFQIAFKHINIDTNSLIENIPTNFQNLGHGAIRLALFSLFIMKDIADGRVRENSKKEYLILFEEPELFLHPKLTKSLRNLIYKVSDDGSPFQILSASHSPQMIDITKPKSSLIRMIKTSDGTRLFQVDESMLMSATNKTQVREELFEAIRFNPFICESFYSDEVILVEGDTESVIIRAYFTEVLNEKDIFVVNCGTVRNIPFFQKVFAQFNIKYHVICDTDGKYSGEFDSEGVPILTSDIQKSIYNEYKIDRNIPSYNYGQLFLHDSNFEDAHRKVSKQEYKYNYTESQIASDGKPYCANEYWKSIIKPNIANEDITEIPIIGHLYKIINN